MEFDKYGRIKNPTISSPQSVNTYTQIQNNHNSRTFFLWDWFNDLVIGIGNFIANSTDFIIGALALIIIISGCIYAISALIDVWSNHGFFIAALITIFGGGLLYTIVVIILGILSWVVAIFLFMIRYIFYNAYTLLLFLGIILCVRWYVNKDYSSSVYQEPVNNSVINWDVNKEEMQDARNESGTEGSNVKESNIEKPIIDKSIVEESTEKEINPITKSAYTSIRSKVPSLSPSTKSKRSTSFSLEKVDKIPTQKNSVKPKIRR